MRRLLVLAALLVALPAGAVDIEYVAVRDSDNLPDTATNCFAADCGAVPYDYAISRYEITNAQYAEFLNAVAASDDPFGLYNPDMSISPFFDLSTGMFFYDVAAGFESKPVVYVSFWDALRFANWLHNGQPSGTQVPGTTEDGAYTITAEGVADNGIARNAGATYFIPSENEWYKAAYYDPAPPGYYDYPAGTDTPTTCAAPGATPNTANCEQLGVVGAVTYVGAYSASPSSYGTFDQGGNVWEWNEQVLSGSFRGIRGGSWDNNASSLAASNWVNFSPTFEYSYIGFRVASLVPEPAQVLLLLTGGVVLAATRRRRA